jgi:DNA helicase-2/ATP-dependent DNA helicase PcrA
MQNTLECAPSPFLEEIPQHLIAYHEPPKAVDDAAVAENFFAQIRAQLQ